MIPVVFDPDGTLIDSLPNVADAANALLAAEGQAPLTNDVVAGFVGMGERVFLDRLIAATELRAADFDRLMPQFIRHYKIAAEDTRLFPGAMEMLNRFRAEGVPLALCTNKPAAPLWPTLKAAEIDAVFDVVLAGDMLAKRKPDPLPVHHILAELSAETCLYVGDSETDAETALRAGVPFALYTEGIRIAPIEDIPHDVAFSDLLALPEIYARFKDVGS